MRNHKRNGQITIVELLLIVVIFLFGYWVVVAPMSKTNDKVKEGWVTNNLSTVQDAIDYLQKDSSFVLEKMSINDVDVLRAKWNKPPLEWPSGVLFDSFKAETNKLSVVVEFSYGTNVVTYMNLPEE